MKIALDEPSANLVGFLPASTTRFAYLAITLAASAPTLPGDTPDTRAITSTELEVYPGTYH